MVSPLAAQTVTASYIYAAHYGYSDRVLHNDNQLRIFPLADPDQEPLGLQLWTRPEGRAVEYRDRFGNRVRRVHIAAQHDRLVIATAGRVRLATQAPAPGDAAVAEVTDLPEGFDFTFKSPLVNPDGVAGVAREIAGPARSLLEVLRATVDWVHHEIRYRRGATGVTTTAEQVLGTREGVCQDKTHLALGMLRALGIPCRYVSGLLTGQVGETHAWLEVLHPRSGWLAVDPTRGVYFPPARDYIKLAIGRDYSDVSPVVGSFQSKGAATEYAAIVSVRFADTEADLDDALELLSRHTRSATVGGRPELMKEQHIMDPGTIAPGTDRWLTDSRVYNLIWLGRWIERAQSVARMLRWATGHAATKDLEDVLGMAADVRGITVSANDSALEVLLTGDSGGSLRGCLESARYNATHVAPVEVIRIIGTAIATLNRHDPASSPADVAALMQSVLSTLDELHAAVEEAWFHSDTLSEGEADRRFVQQQQS